MIPRIWPWVYYNKTPIYPIFYLPKGDYSVGFGGYPLLSFASTSSTQGCFGSRSRWFRA